MSIRIKFKAIGLVVPFLGLVLILSACDNQLGPDDDEGGGESEATTYAIGDTGPSGVGIVFYVTDGGVHGLEVAPEDQATYVEWSDVNDTEVGTATAIETGSANTDAIIAQTGHSVSAAQVSRDYRAAEEGDWFLPSQDELNAIWDNLVDDGTGDNNGVGNFADLQYWSSSENDATTAFFQRFLEGAQNYTGKGGGTEGHVRAIRAF